MAVKGLRKGLGNIIAFSLFLLCLLPHKGYSHALNQSYIYMQVLDEDVKGRFEITTKDLNNSLGLDLKPDLNLDDLEPYLAQIKEYLIAQVGFSSSLGQHDIIFKDTRIVVRRTLGTYLLMDFDLKNSNPVPEALQIRYDAIIDKNANHSGVLVIENNFKAGIVRNEAGVSLVFTPGSNEQELPLEDISVWMGFWAMLKMGAWHIWIGIDHILFLFALILPSVLVLSTGAKPQNPNSFKALLSSTHYWQAVDHFRPAFWNIIKIISFFTLAHSITLSLAALEIIVLPSRFVESIIAFSIALAAVHNMRPILGGKDWIIAFVFGLFHGFGFASVLSEVGLSPGNLVLSLLGFNLGVELGQLLIIAIIFPILYILRKTALYAYILNFGSVLLIFISLFWFIERAFAVNIPIRKVYNFVFGK